MTKLRALRLDYVTLDDGFFSVMSESTSQSQVARTLLFLASNKNIYISKCIRLLMCEIRSGH